MPTIEGHGLSVTVNEATVEEYRDRASRGPRPNDILLPYEMILTEAMTKLRHMRHLPFPLGTQYMAQAKLAGWDIKELQK